VPENTGEVIRHRIEAERAVVKRINYPLNWPIKIRSGRIDKKEMIEAFRNQSPAADKRVAQDQCGIVPDETIAQRGRIGNQDRERQDEKRKDFLHQQNRLDRIN